MCGQTASLNDAPQMLWLEKSAVQQEQVDFSTEQVTFHCLLSNGQGTRQLVCQLNKKINQDLLRAGKI